MREVPSPPSRILYSWTLQQHGREKKGLRRPPSLEGCRLLPMAPGTWPPWVHGVVASPRSLDLSCCGIQRSKLPMLGHPRQGLSWGRDHTLHHDCIPVHSSGLRGEARGASWRSGAPPGRWCAALTFLGKAAASGVGDEDPGVGFHTASRQGTIVMGFVRLLKPVCFEFDALSSQ